MSAEPAAHSRVAPEPWLEIIEARSPLLLVAPHGGRAGPAARATLHPKVNDLHTVEITRELAARLGASALINHGMDRNQLDCNRLPQVMGKAPWLLELLADSLEDIVDRHGQALVLLIHGWNIIQPRIDFGLGVRAVGGELRPVGSAHVVASDEFINGPLVALAEKMRVAGIVPSFGMRYPAGAIHNLVQAFSTRHCDSPDRSLRRIARLAEDRFTDAVQFEISVAARMPGPVRERCIDAIVEVFARGPQPQPAPTPASRSLTVVRTAQPRRPPPMPRSGPAIPARAGVEFFDPAANLGAMASFDLGTPGFGGRIMMLLGPRRVVLFTGEGKLDRAPGRIALGPLSLSYADRALELRFRGPAVLVPDSAAYVSIEAALASGRLVPSLEVDLRMPLPSDGMDLACIFDAQAESPRGTGSSSAFGVAEGEVVVDATRYSIHAMARAGLSFTGLGPQRFLSRRMIWACFADGAQGPAALEIRETSDSDQSTPHRSARLLEPLGWSEGVLDELEIETPAVEEPPHRLAARFESRDGRASGLTGRYAAYVPLSRPGPDRTRIYTSLGFAHFSLDGRAGAGMFEYSRVCDAPSSEADDEDDEAG